MTRERGDKREEKRGKRREGKRMVHEGCALPEPGEPRRGGAAAAASEQAGEVCLQKRGRVEVESPLSERGKRSSRGYGKRLHVAVVVAFWT